MLEELIKGKEKGVEKEKGVKRKLKKGGNYVEKMII